MTNPKFFHKISIFIILLLVAGSIAFAKEQGVITLRLEEPETSKTQNQSSAQTHSPAAPQSAPDGLVPQYVTAPAPKIGAASAVLMDAATGEVLYSKNGHIKRPNASTTKMLTAILMIEHVDMDDVIIASKNVSQTPYTSLHLMPGEHISARDLLFGMLIRSANDAAVAAAEHIAGNTKAFAKMMNKRAAEIGCGDSHFVTPNGLYDKNHYSSAYDLCLIARYGFRYPLFNEAVSTRKWVLDSRTKNRKDLAVFAKSKFMKDYPGADGVKSGYLKQAGHCYVGSATRNGWRLVAAVLKSDNTTLDTAALMDYGFGNFALHTVARANATISKAKVKGGEAGTVAVATSQDFRVPVVKTGAIVTTKVKMNKLEAPVEKGAKIGELVAMVNGKEVASSALFAKRDVGVSLGRRMWPWMGTSSILVVCIMVGRKYYGTAFTKDPRRRRRRVTATLRNVNRFR